MNAANRQAGTTVADETISYISVLDFPTVGKLPVEQRTQQPQGGRLRRYDQPVVLCGHHRAAGHLRWSREKKRDKYMIVGLAWVPVRMAPGDALTTTEAVRGMLLTG